MDGLLSVIFAQSPSTRLLSTGQIFNNRPTGSNIRAAIHVAVTQPRPLSL